MTRCPTCDALMFVRCGTHGEWCPRCSRALSCPRCQAGSISLALLLILLFIITAGSLVVALTDFRTRLRAPVEPAAIPQRACSTGRAASCPAPHVRPPA